MSRGEQWYLHEEHVSRVVRSPVNREGLLLHLPAAHRPQINVIALLQHTNTNCHFSGLAAIHKYKLSFLRSTVTSQALLQNTNTNCHFSGQHHCLAATHKYKLSLFRSTSPPCCNTQIQTVTCSVGFLANFNIQATQKVF